jgi:hypothetical protein
MTQAIKEEVQKLLKLVHLTGREEDRWRYLSVSRNGSASPQFWQCACASWLWTSQPPQDYKTIWILWMPSCSCQA